VRYAPIKQGFSHLFLFFDEPLNDEASCALGGESAEEEHITNKYPPTTQPLNHPAISALTSSEIGLECITIISGQDKLLQQWQKNHCPSWNKYSSFLTEEVQARQVMNAETALVLAEKENVSWLVHLDIDELFYTGPRNEAEMPNSASSSSSSSVSNADNPDCFLLPSSPQGHHQFQHMAPVQDHFRDLENQHIYHMTYINHEAVPESKEVVDYFKEVWSYKRERELELELE
jgi:hypothetical protein